MNKTMTGNRSQRGYVLPFVLILTAAIVATSTAVSMVTLVEASSSTQDVNAVSAFAVAYGGAQQALSALNEEANAGTLAAKATTLLNGAPSASIGTTTALTFHNVDNATNGMSPIKPGGDGTKYDVGDGYYRLFLTDDINDLNPDSSTEPDSNSMLTVRVYAKYSNAEAMVEANYMSLQFPGSAAAFAGCFANQDADMIYESRQGPGLPFFSFRMDGAYAPTVAQHKPAVAFNVDPYRMDGYQQEYTSCAHHRHHHGHCGNSFIYNKYLWYLNPDTDNEWGNYVAPFHLSNYPLPATTAIDEGDGMGTPAEATPGYGFRPYGLMGVISVYSAAANNWYDPGAPGRTISTASSIKDDTTQYRLPIIAFKGNPRQIEKTEKDTPNYDYLHDIKAARGIYACYADKSSQVEAASKCVSGNDKGAGADWDNEATMMSGIAWNYVQTIVRKCTGTGINATCGGDYGFLENAAQCLILPADVKRANNVPASAGDTGGTEADYRDGTGIYKYESPGNLNLVDHDHSWYPGGYPRVKLATGDQAYDDLATCAALNDYSVCGGTASGVISAEARAMRAMMAQGICRDSEGKIRVKFCKPDTLFDNGTTSYHCVNDWRAWTTAGCTDGWSRVVGGAAGYFSSPLPAMNCAIDAGRNCTCNVVGISTACTPGNANTCDIAVSGTPAHTYCKDQDGNQCLQSPNPTAPIPTLDWSLEHCTNEAGGFASATANANWGDFTTCADDCYINDGGLHRSVCINLDAHHVAKYGDRSNPTWTNGERGSIHMISRFDLSDDGPLGKCSLATKTCRTSGIDKMPAWGNGAYPAGTWDGTGEFMGPFARHPRVSSTGQAQFPPFSRTIRNPPDLIDRDAWTPITIPPPSFCPEGGDHSELFDVVAATIESADVIISTGALDPAPITPAVGATFGGLTYGGAVCKYDGTKVGPSYAGWYVQNCDDANWELVTIKNSMHLGGKFICGCGMLIIKPSGVGKLELDSNNKSDALAWRGLVFMMSGANDTRIELEETGNGIKSLFIDGSLILLVEKESVKRFYLEMKVDPGNLTASAWPGISTYIRYNEAAVQKSLSLVKFPYTAFRMLY